MKDSQKSKEFDIVVAEVERAGGKISAQIPAANWRHIEGNFTPSQLRIIADQIDREYKK